MDNHRSTAGNSAESNGLWYVKSSSTDYPESKWITDWVNIQSWVLGAPQSTGATDTVNLNYLASDNAPIVLGYELRNEPHTPPRTAYLQGATWGTGDGASTPTNSNPNPFAPGCVATSTCHDWRLAAERAGDSLLGNAAAKGWAYPLLLVNGISQYPMSAQGTAANGPYDYYWWGGDLQGVNGTNAKTNPGAPILLNAGGNPSGLGPSVVNCSTPPTTSARPNTNTATSTLRPCYKSGCDQDPPGTGPNSSLADVWKKYWAYINTANGIAPAGNTSPYSQAPILISEFGTGNTDSSLVSTGKDSQGQWFTDMVNFVQSSYTRDSTKPNWSGIPLTDLNWTYWAVNGEDGYGFL